MKNTFGEIITAMVTPFNSSLEIDYNSCEKLIDHLIKNGSDSIVVAGTTGESPTLTHEEERELCKFVQKKSNGKIKIILGCGSNCTKTAIEATKLAEKLGVDGVLSVVPYYNKPSQEGLISHFSEIAKSTSLPIILYNIPGRTGILMQVETIAELAHKHKNIIANKDACGDLDITSKTIQLCPSNFIVYSGDDSLFLPMLSVGAKGIISVASHIVGKKMKEMVRAYFEGKIEIACKIHHELFPLFKALFKAPNPTCVKVSLEEMGICKSELRLPLVKLNENNKNELKAVLKNFI